MHTDETAPETTEDNGHDDVIREPEISLATIGEPIVRPEVDFYGWRKLGQAVIPSGLISRRTRWYQRLWEMVKLPYFLVFSLTIPICETEEDDHEIGEVSSNGGNEESISSYDKTWSQYLHVVQVLAFHRGTVPTYDTYIHAECRYYPGTTCYIPTTRRAMVRFRKKGLEILMQNNLTHPNVVVRWFVNCDRIGNF